MQKAIFYSPDELASTFKLSANTIRRLIRAGHIKAVKLPDSRTYRIPDDEFKRLLAGAK